MKRTYNLFAALACFVLAISSASAANLTMEVLPNSDGEVVLSDLIGDGKFLNLEGGVALSDFSYIRGTSPSMPGASDVTVVVGDSYGSVAFQAGWLDLAGGTASDSTLQFTVSHPGGALFTGITLAGNPSVGGTIGSGVAAVTETLFETGLPEPIQLDILSVFNPGNVPVTLETSATFSSAIPEFRVVKDILLFANGEGPTAAPATLSILEQEFVPEPSSIALSLVGLLGLGLARRRN